MNQLMAVAATLSTDFTKTVQAIQKAEASVVQAQIDALRSASAQRVEGLEKVRGMREQAAKLISESFKLEEEIEARFSSAVAGHVEALDVMRTEKFRSRAIKAKAPLKALPGKKG